MKKERIDILCVEKGLFDSREKAKRAIMAGIVRDDYDYIDKPGTKIPVDSNLYIKGEKLKYVSRGGLKLEKALHYFNVDITHSIMVDIGSSTGGFTDCALQNGADLIYALDVGTNQLVWSLRNNPKVISMEKTNFRYATIDMFKSGQPTFATIDVSFISLKHILPPLHKILKENSYCVCLIKPQFEAGKNDVGKHGIVSNPDTHIKVLNNVYEYIIENNMSLMDITFSPITGGTGNIEFLGLIKNEEESSKKLDFRSIVGEAYSYFKG